MLPDTTLPDKVQFQGENPGPLPLILASQSPSRRKLLLTAGIRPTISVSHVDENAVVAQTAADRMIDPVDLPARDRVQVLARAKAQAVASRYSDIHKAVLSAEGNREVYRPYGIDPTSQRSSHSQTGSTSQKDFRSFQPLQDFLRIHPGLSAYPEVYGAGPLVIGSDSLFEIGGTIYGKPHTAQIARDRLQAMRGSTGILWTGHCLIDPYSGRKAEAVSRAEVHFADYSNKEIDAYIATGEPLEVAGCFTLEGIGAAFIDSIHGSPSGVIGLSLPLVRSLASQLGVSWTDLWNMAVSRPAGSSEEDHSQSKGKNLSRDYLSGQDRRAAVDVPSDNITQPGDGWIPCVCGHKHWGTNGAAGVLLIRTDPVTGQATYIVMQHRAAWSAEGGTWAIPGGAVSEGENSVEGALREAWEEAGIAANDISIVGAYDEDHGPWNYTTVFAVEKEGHQVQPYVGDDESIEITWVPLDDVNRLNLLSAFRSDWPHFRELIRKMADKRAAVGHAANRQSASGQAAA